MKLVLKLNNNILKSLKTFSFYVLISLLSLLTVSADEENPKSKNSSNIFRQPKTDRVLGEICLLPTECSRTMHLTCIQRHCECDDGYIKSNNTCLIKASNKGFGDYLRSPMLPILIVLAIMFVGICVALNLFSRARFRKSRSIFVNPKILRVAKAQERRASQLSQLSQRSHNGLRSPTSSYRSPRNSIITVSPTHSYNGNNGKHCYGNHILDPKRSPNNRSRSNSTSSLQIHLRA